MRSDLEKKSDNQTQSAERRTRFGLLFPGQGSQAVGMGKELVESFPIAKETFQEADQSLKLSLSELCWNGPEETLKLTEYTQPAVMTTSIAAARVLREQFGDKFYPTLLAGHSLGEWSSVVWGEGLPFSDAVQLVRLRGKFMQEAVPEGKGKMAALLGVDLEKAEKLCESVEPELGICVPANINSPTQIVISGDREAVERAIRAAKEEGIRAIPLAVSAPFHSPLMEPAAEKLASELKRVKFSELKTPVVSNVTAKPYSSPSESEELLIRQITAPVRWIDVIKTMVESGIKHFIEVGHGRVLSGLIRQIDRSLTVYNFGKPKDLEKIAQFLEQI